MPRGRMLSKSISKSEKVAKLSVEGKLLFTWILPHVDVQGRIEADVWTIKAIVPYVDEITPKTIPELLTQMHKAGLIIYYGDEHKYLQIVDFLKYQKVRTDQEAPSHIPAPTEQQSRNGVETFLPPLNVSKGNVSKGKGIERFTPPSLADLVSYKKEIGAVFTEPEVFLNHYIGNGWFVGKTKMKDWKATFRNWEHREAKKHPAKPKGFYTQLKEQREKEQNVI